MLIRLRINQLDQSEIAMNNSSDSTIAAPTSNLQLWERLFQAFIYVILLGLFSGIGNTVISLGIARSNTLRTRFFVIIAFLSVCRALLSFQYLAVGLFRIFKNLGKNADAVESLCGSVRDCVKIFLTWIMVTS